MEPRPEGIDNELLARVMEVATARGETVDDVIERALRAYLNDTPELRRSCPPFGGQNLRNT